MLELKALIFLTINEERGRSLDWLEHPADNREVVGSNPIGPM